MAVNFILQQLINDFKQDMVNYELYLKKCDRLLIPKTFKEIFGYELIVYPNLNYEIKWQNKQ